MIIHICHSLALALALVSTSFDFSEGTLDSMSFMTKVYSPPDAWVNASAVYQGNDVRLTCSQNKPETPLTIRRLNSETDSCHVTHEANAVTTYTMKNIQCQCIDTYVCEDGRGKNKTLDLGIYNCAPLPCNGTTHETIFIAVNESKTFPLCVIAYPNISDVATIDGKMIRTNPRNETDLWSLTCEVLSFSRHTINITIRNKNALLYGRHIFSITSFQMGAKSLNYTFDIKKPEAPGCPNDFNITSPGLTNVTITWRPGFDGGSNQWFDVSYKINNETVEEWSPTWEVNEPYAEVTDLQAGTNYVLKVEPRNKYHRKQCYSFPFHTESPTESNDSTKDDEDKNLMIAIILSVVVLAVTVCIATIVGIILYKKIRKLYFRVRVPKDPMTTTTPNNPRVQYLHRENNNRTFDSAERHLLDSSISSGNTTLDVGGFNSRAPHA